MFLSKKQKWKLNTPLNFYQRIKQNQFTEHHILFLENWMYYHLKSYRPQHLSSSKDRCWWRFSDDKTDLWNGPLVILYSYHLQHLRIEIIIYWWRLLPGHHGDHVVKTPYVNNFIVLSIYKMIPKLPSKRLQ